MNKPVKSISPDEIAEYKKGIIPDFVIEAFNKCIARRYCNGFASVEQDDVLTEIIASGKTDYSRQGVIDQGWLDVEDLYRAEGWEVEYDKPGYNESYRPHFNFRKRR